MVRTVFNNIDTPTNTSLNGNNKKKEENKQTKQNPVKDTESSIYHQENQESIYGDMI